MEPDCLETSPITGSAIERLAQAIAADLAATEALINDRMASPVQMIPDLAAHLVHAGGKRLRPVLTLASAHVFGGGGARAAKLAAAVEFIHSATLLHDDVVDGSGMRRGKRAAQMIWGNAGSVLVGDFLFARAFNLTVETGDLRILDVLARASSVIAEGEVLQLHHVGDLGLSLELYQQIIDAKTATLFAAACEAGAISAGADEAAFAAMAHFGRSLGIAFQLVDDALDYAGDAQALGKATGDDFREGKLTMPLLLARAASAETETAFWRRVAAGEAKTEQDWQKALTLIAQSGAIATTLDTARRHVEAAKAALALAPAGPIRDLLSDLADESLKRAA